MNTEQQLQTKRIKMEGRKVGMLTVLERADNIGSATAYKCLCECGNERVIRYQSLALGHTKSCGCLRASVMRAKQTKHGFYKTPTYNSYRSMLARCYDTTHKQYKDYGGRGITVCDEWLSGFMSFFRDMGERGESLTLDRIENDKGYNALNCKWSTRIEQNKNKRYVN